VQNGLQKRIEASEGYLPVSPVIGRVAEDVQQLLAGLFVKFGVRRDLLEHHNEARLWAGLVQWVGHAVVQSVKVFTEVRWQGELASDQIEHVLFALGTGQVGEQEVVPQTLSGFLQVVHAESANRLDDVRPYTFERCFRVLTKWRIHLRGSFYSQKNFSLWLLFNSSHSTNSRGTLSRFAFALPWGRA